MHEGEKFVANLCSLHRGNNNQNKNTMKMSPRKFTKIASITSLASVSGWFMLAAPASGVFPTPVIGVDTPPNDSLALLFPDMDELGDPGIFPLGERVSHSAGPTALVASVATDGAGPNALVSITNLQPFSLYNLHYTCNPGTGFSNVDGTINGLIAFKIDYAGINVPLKFESMTADAIFEPGETWGFVVDDFVSFGPPDGFFGIGVPDASPVNLLADLVPEPGSMGLLALGAMALAGRRARKS